MKLRNILTVAAIIVAIPVFWTLMAVVMFALEGR